MKRKIAKQLLLEHTCENCDEYDYIGYETDYKPSCMTNNHLVKNPSNETCSNWGYSFWGDLTERSK